MTERIKELLLSESLEDGWLAIEMMRGLKIPEAKISNDIRSLVINDGYLVNRYFRLKLNRYPMGKPVRGKGRYTYYLRKDIYDY